MSHALYQVFIQSKSGFSLGVAKDGGWTLTGSPEPLPIKDALEAVRIMAATDSRLGVTSSTYLVKPVE